MQNRVLDAAAVKVDGHPVFRLRRLERQRVVPRVAEAIEVPGRIDERVHRVGFAPCLAAAFWAGDVHELRHLRERRVASAGKVRHLRQLDRQLVVGHRDNAARVAIDHRYRRAPIALARDAPILQAELHGPFAYLLLLHPLAHARERRFRRETREFTRAHQTSVVHVGFVELFWRAADRRIGLDDDFYRQPIFRRELEVALIVSRHGHHGARTVFTQHEVGDPHWHRLARKRIHHAMTGEKSFLLDLAREPCCTVLGAKGDGTLTKRGRVIRLGCILLDQRMLGRQEDARRAEDRVDSRRKYFDLAELDACAFRPSDPVLLHRQHFFGPLAQLLDALEKIVGVFGDLEEPLF